MTNPEGKGIENQLRTLYLKSTRALRESGRQALKKKALQEAVQAETLHLNQLTARCLDRLHTEGFKAEQKSATLALGKANRKLAKFYDSYEDVEDRTTKALTALRDYLTTQINERNK